MDKTSDDTSEAGTLRRGLRVLRVLQEAGDTGLKISEIAGEAGVPRPTVYRLLDVLVTAGFARAEQDTRRFTSAAPHRAPRDRWDTLVRKLTPAMQRLAGETGNSIFLVRRQGGDALCVHREFGNYPIQVHAVAIGAAQPMGVGAAGLALLAAYSEAEAERIIVSNRHKLPSRGGLTAAKLRLLVNNSRTRGYAVAANHSVAGVLGVGIAVRDKSNTPLAGLSVGSTVERLPPDKQKRMVQLMRRELMAVM
jgi:DNA-binding IclR family transcriptional regulator